MAFLARIKDWAKKLKREILTLWLAASDGRVPRHAKIVAGVVAAYALSPIDLIPDLVPFLGFLDELIVLPLGIMLAIKLIPAPLLTELRGKAAMLSERPVSRAGLAAILAIWLLCLIFAVWYMTRET